jgi:hypothetical protein
MEISDSVETPYLGVHETGSRPNLGIDTGAAIVGTIEVGHFSAKPPKIRNLIDSHQHMVIRDQTPQRPGDEKLQLTTFFPTQHRCLKSLFSQVNQRHQAFSTAPTGLFSDPPLTSAVCTSALTIVLGPMADNGSLDVKEADGAGLELLLRGQIAVHLGKSADAMPLQAPVQRGPRQMRDGRLQRIEAVVERQERVAAKGDDHRFLFSAEHG